MKTLITLEIDHPKEAPDLAEKIANRGHTMQGVESCIVLSEKQVEGMDSQMGALDDPS